MISGTCQLSRRDSCALVLWTPQAAGKADIFLRVDLWLLDVISSKHSLSLSLRLLGWLGLAGLAASFCSLRCYCSVWGLALGLHDPWPWPVPGTLVPGVLFHELATTLLYL